MMKVKRFLCGALCVTAVLTTVICSFLCNQTAAEGTEIQTITLWQIDGFEGGTGSRAAYLQEKANEYKKLGNEYVNVVALSAQAARLNIESGNKPDIISFSGGEWGLEGIINSDHKIDCWCHGSYCLLSLDENADFAEADSSNTVINEGKSNLSQAAALLCGLEGAAVQSPTYAYVDLINGKYDFLLGTQRDIYRLNARKVTYSVKPVNEYNDLFQLIAVCADDTSRAEASDGFIEYLLVNNFDVYKLGMLGGDTGVNEKIVPLENISYNLKLGSPISKTAREEIENAVSLKDINKLKTLLK